MDFPSRAAYRNWCAVSLLLVLIVACVGAPSASKEVARAPGEAHGSVLLSDLYQTCASSNDGSVWEMQECVEAEFQRQDARLNAAYRMLRSKLPPDGRSKLKEEERRWVAEKESACAWDAESGGQAQRVAANICSLEKTAERAAYLEGKL